MSKDSELENLQCYPFHWPEKRARKPQGLWLLSGLTQEAAEKLVSDYEELGKALREATYIPFCHNATEEGSNDDDP